MHFRFLDDDLDLERAVCVDGVCDARLNLSHWPGNRTPDHLRHDLSTGIALRLVGDRDASKRLLDQIDVVTNNHFDTDGVLSAFTLLHPDTALAHGELLLEAATAGDMQVFTSARGLAIDLTLTAIGAAVPASADGARRQRQYDAALAAVPALLHDPWCNRSMIDAALAEILADLDARPGVRIERDPDAQLALLTSDRPLHRVAVNTFAGDALRVFHQIPYGRGQLYRLHERVESWFDLVTVRPPARRDWTSLAERLEALEAPEADAHWIAEPIGSPVPELYFGETAGSRADPTALTALCTSRLSPRLVTAAIVDHYTS